MLREVMGGDAPLLVHPQEEVTHFLVPQRLLDQMVTIGGFAYDAHLKSNLT